MRRAASLLAALAVSTTAFASTAARADPVVSITVNTSIALAADRLALLVSGTYSCSGLPPDPNDFNLGGFVEVLQAQGQDINQGFGDIEDLVCDGQVREWQSLVTPYYEDEGPWHGGTARVEAEIGVFIQNPCCQSFADSVNSSVKIRGGGKF